MNRLALIALLLVSVLIAELTVLDRATPEFGARANSPEKDPIRVPTPRKLPHKRYFSLISEKSMFGSNGDPAAETSRSARRGGTGYPANAQAFNTTVGGYRLVGITISRQDRLALIEDSLELNVERVREGGSVGEWKVESIHPREIDLSKNGRLETMRFIVDGE